MNQKEEIKVLKLYEPFEIPKTLEKKDLVRLVDEAVRLKDVAEKIGERLELIKAAVKEEAKAKSLPRNKKGECIIKGTGTHHIMLTDSAVPLEIDPHELYHYLKKHDQKAVFWGFVKAKVTEFKAAFGVVEAEKLAGGKPKVLMYHKVYVKAKP